jgi:two-component system LytT family response regulator
MKVFIVDDSALVRERIMAMISEHPGIEITGQAKNAQEGINSILKLKPNTVILDIRMPGGNGIEVLKNIRMKQEDGN